MLTHPEKPFDLKFFLLFIPAAYASYLFHELGHWAVGELLGNRMVYTLNYVWPRDGGYIQANHEVIVSIGGPAFSILQAVLALLVIEKTKALYIYPFAFFPAFSRFFSLVFGGFAKQDEARVSMLLGIGGYVIPALVLAVLLLIVIRCSSDLRLGLKSNGYIFTASTVAQLMVIGTYEFISL